MTSCLAGRHFSGTPVINLGAVVDHRGDFPGRHRHRAVREHAFVQRCGDDKHGCGRPEDEDPDVICGFYREFHPTMLQDDETCTHEMIYLGNCVGCGEAIEYDDGYEPQPPTGCQNRGWYHDGSEEESALAQGRAPRPCPHHSGQS